MIPISLNDAPLAVTNPDAWTRGEPGPVAVGDLWLLSWNGLGVGLGVISARLPGYVLLWPAMLPGDDARAPAIRVADSPLGVAVDVWPTRETGVGDALLHRRICPLLTPRLMAGVGDAIDEGEVPPLPFAPPASDVVAQRVRDEEMIDHWDAVCLTQWPTTAATAPRLNREAAREYGLTPSWLSALLEIGAADAVALFVGDRTLSLGQADVISAELGALAPELLAPAQDTAATALLDPRWKTDVLALAARRELPEAAARDLVISEFALAARSSNSSDDRLSAVFARLLAD